MIKRTVSEDDQVKTIMQKCVRHVSSNVTLNELARLLTRYDFAIVDKTKIVTTTDLIDKVSTSMGNKMFKN